ncbi:MAG: hypothetical protein KGI27_10035 [Thaumarchaeota archaeon]|nr:hypothetical protein [Nitrososphaerota archaeon]
MEQELLYDALAIDEDEDESLDSVGRVEELENVLSNIIDLWDRDLLVANASEGPTDEVFEIMEKAYTVLAQYEEGVD